MRRIPNEELINRVRDLAETIGRTPTTLDIRDSDTMPSIPTYYRRFGPWDNVITEADLPPLSDNLYSDAELIQILQELAEDIETVPTTKDLEQDTNLPSASTYYLRFENWKSALVTAGLIPDYATLDTFGRYTNWHSPSDVLAYLRDCEVTHGTVNRDVFTANYVSRNVVESHFGTFSRAKRAADLDDVGQTKIIDSKRIQLEEHIQENTYLQEISKGLLLGDGHIDNGGKNACLRVGMITKPFLEWLDSQFGDISTGVRLKATAEDSAAAARRSGFRPNAKDENYHDVYELSTRRLPYFTQLRQQWYPSGTKSYPDNLKLSDTSCLSWYCGDGGVNTLEPLNIGITCSNESHRKRYLESLFDTTPVQPILSTKKLVFNKADSETFLEWVGKSPPGFEYKWARTPEEYTHLKTKLD